MHARSCTCPRYVYIYILLMNTHEYTRFAKKMLTSVLAERDQREIDEDFTSSWLKYVEISTCIPPDWSGGRRPHVFFSARCRSSIPVCQQEIMFLEDTVESIPLGWLWSLWRGFWSCTKDIKDFKKKRWNFVKFYCNILQEPCPPSFLPPAEVSMVDLRIYVYFLGVGLSNAVLPIFHREFPWFSSQWNFIKKNRKH